MATFLSIGEKATAPPTQAATTTFRASERVVIVVFHEFRLTSELVRRNVASITCRTIVMRRLHRATVIQ